MLAERLKINSAQSPLRCGFGFAFIGLYDHVAKMLGALAGVHPDKAVLGALTDHVAEVRTDYASSSCFRLVRYDDEVERIGDLMEALN